MQLYCFMERKVMFVSPSPFGRNIQLHVHLYVYKHPENKDSIFLRKVYTHHQTTSPQCHVPEAHNLDNKRYQHFISVTTRFLDIHANKLSSSVILQCYWKIFIQEKTDITGDSRGGFPVTNIYIYISSHRFIPD